MATSAGTIPEFDISHLESWESRVEHLNLHFKYHEAEDAAKKKDLLLASYDIATLEPARSLVTTDDLKMVAY